MPIHLDVTSARDIAAAATTCADIEILINNAGAMLATPVLAENSEDMLRREMEVNVFGMLAMSRAPLGDLYADLVSVFTPSMRTVLGLGSRVEDVIAGPFSRHAGDPAAAAGFADLGTYLANDILMKVDIASMANGLEVRCPFLDRDVVDLALRMPTALRRGKGVLRTAFHDLVPASILARRKMGFGVPLTEWLRGSLRPLLEDAMSTLSARGLLESLEIRRLTSEHLSGAADHRDRLWLLLVLELWARRFL